jgi:hypothetical protein
MGNYRKFIRKYGEIARPLTQLLKKYAFGWSPLVEHAFHGLKKAMNQALALALPDFSKDFIVECDTSGGGGGYRGCSSKREACHCVFQPSLAGTKPITIHI